MRIPPMLALIACLLAIPAIASAQHTGGGSHTGGSHTGGGGEGGATAEDRFGARYTEASRAWHDGRYDDALRLFSALYDETHRPELLYDLGVTYERLDRLDDAIRSFQSYVDALPMARNRMQVENRIASLREDLRRRAGTSSTAPTTTATATAPRGDRPIMSLLGPDAEESRPEATPVTTTPPRTETVIEGGGPEWIVTWPFLALTLATAIAAPIAWDQGWRALADLEAECGYFMDCTQATIDGSAAKQWEIATNVLLVSALVLGAATVITFVAEAATPTERREVERPLASLHLDVGLGTIALRGTFR